MFSVTMILYKRMPHFLNPNSIKSIKPSVFIEQRECMATDIIIFHRVGTNDNLADMLTNSLPRWKRVQLGIRNIYSINYNIP